MRIENDVKLDFKDVLIRPKRSTLSSRSEVSLVRSYVFKHSKWNFVGVPIIAANMDGVGTFEMAKALSKAGMLTCLTKHTNPVDIITRMVEDNLTPHAVVSIGTSEEDLNKLDRIYSDLKQTRHSLLTICIDVANGYTERFVDTVRLVREKYPYLTIIAGNVVTGEMTEELILNGADIVKVGIGPGSVCTTRIKTGVGYPQLSAIIECADAAHGLGGHIIADGGCTSPGDIAKAFGAGADFIMLGGMLAGHDEGGGDIVTKTYITNEVIVNDEGEWLEQPTETKKFVQFYGMSSKAANDKHFGGLKDYRSSEGREVYIPYRGPVSDTVQDILGGLRSACTYVGASQLKYLSKCTTFIRVTQQYNGVFERN
jgi:GMP reductase